jgi:hypothetical protein
VWEPAMPGADLVAPPSLPSSRGVDNAANPGGSSRLPCHSHASHVSACGCVVCAAERERLRTGLGAWQGPAHRVRRAARRWAAPGCRTIPRRWRCLGGSASSAVPIGGGLGSLRHVGRSQTVRSGMQRPAHFTLQGSRTVKRMVRRNDAGYTTRDRGTGVAHAQSYLEHAPMREACIALQRHCAARQHMAAAGKRAQAGREAKGQGACFASKRT